MIGAQTISRLTAIGITAILWPICIVGEGIVIWKVANPSWLTGAGRGMGSGPVPPPDWDQYFALGGLLLSSLLLAVSITWMISKLRERKAL
jgi:hypothetical protein